MLRKIRIDSLLLLIAILISGRAWTQDFIPGRLIIILRPAVVDNLSYSPDNTGLIKTNHPALNRLFDKYEVDKFEPEFIGGDGDFISAKGFQMRSFFIVSFDAKYSLDQVEQDFLLLQDVLYTERDALCYTSPTYPNDNYFGNQWGLNQTSDHDVDAPEAWDYTQGSSSVVLGIIDTGVDWQHPDLGGASPFINGNIWINWSEYNGVANTDDDGNGFVDDIRGWDWVDGISVYPGEDGDDPDNNPSDFNGHGTHCAGIASAITNNFTGVAGLGWNCKIMALRAGYTAPNGYGYVQMSFCASAMYYATNNEATAVNCSWGSNNSGGISAAVDYAIAHNITVCVAAGNDNTSSQAYNFLSTRGDCIDVAAVDEGDEKASFSNYGSWVDVSAPGVNIYSTYHNGPSGASTYTYLNGTSMATPFVTGLAGLIRSLNPGWSNTQIRQHIINTADDINSLNPGYQGLLGSGRINAYNAVSTGGGIPDLSWNPTYYNFGNVYLGQSSLPFTFSLTNNGSQTVNGNIDIYSGNVGDFEITSGGGAFALSAGGNRNVEVVFTPSLSGYRESTVRAVVGSYNFYTMVNGYGDPGLPNLSWSPDYYNFGAAQVGTFTPPYPFILYNSGTGSTSGTVYTSGDFYISGNNGYDNLGSGQSATFQVYFQPSASGERYGSLTASSANQPIATLTGYGELPPANLSWWPNSHNFGGVPVGQQSANYTFTLTNFGSANTSGIVYTVGNFYLAGSNDYNLNSGQAATFAVYFQPTEAGICSGTLTASSANQPQALLSGEGIPSTVSFNYYFTNQWNLISLPVEPENNSLQSLFPLATYAYKYENQGYSLVNTIEPGKGYWLYVPNIPYNVTINGVPFNYFSCQVNPMWELLGGIYNQGIPVTTPINGIQVIYWFDYVYNSVNYPFLIEPGRGYWICLEDWVNTFSLGEPQFALLNGENISYGITNSEFSSSIWEMELDIITGQQSDIERASVIIGGDSIARFIPAPPPPPETDLHAELYSDNWEAGPFLKMMMTSDATDYFQWLLAINIDDNINNCSRTVTITWEPISLFPEGQFSIIDFTNGDTLVEDMHGQSSLVIAVITQSNLLIGWNDEISDDTESDQLPETSILFQNSPNPFNNTTTIKYYLNTSDYINLSVYNLKGEIISNFISGYQNAGYHQVNFDWVDLTSGIYFCRLKTEDNIYCKKMLLIK